MKRNLLSILLLFVCIGLIHAEKVAPTVAEKVAANYLRQSDHWSVNNKLVLAEQFTVSAASQFLPGTFEETTLLYVFNIAGEQGFILVSGDDVAAPVLGFTSTGSYDKRNLPHNFQKWLEGYKRQIAYAVHNHIEPIQEVSDAWKALINGEEITAKRSVSAVSPLLSTTWNQSPYYNALCPGGSVTGCVATAMAQVMKYWNHPAQGSGMHSYNHATYGTLSANFGATTYQWSSMPNNVTSSNNAVATLMYHCGVSVDMNYSPNESGAWVVESDSPVCAESAFKNYFGYTSSLHGEKRDGNYSTSQWVQLVKGELDAGRPLLYAGFGTGGGHAFVCDGYDNNDYFHFNWGWGGSYDGYFSIDALDPGGTGTGGGNGGYNSGHQGVFGVQPATGSANFDLRLYDNVVASPNPIGFTQAFSVTTKVGNFGNNNYSGEVAAVVFDNNMNAIEIVGAYNETIESQYWKLVTLSSPGSTNLLPGNYTISIYYRPPGENWIKVGDGDYSNAIAFSVQNDNDIQLYEAMTVSVGNTITKNQPFSVHLDIANYGSDFLGTFDVSIYDLEGYFVETVEQKTNMNLPNNSHYTNGLTFSTSGLTVEPGSYLLALQHMPNGLNWVLTGSNNYPNPIQVVVTAQALQGDMYENNDDINLAYNLPVNFTGNNASVLTTGSNSHTGSDYDYYKISLPSGYDYSINGRAHDSYNSGNGQTYTNDVLWSYNPGNYWSDAYDDVMQGNIHITNGGTVIFLVAPYFLGETGTYLMEFQISRSPAGIEDVSASENIKVYPNPASDLVTIRITQEETIRQVQLTDMMGKMLMRFDKPQVTDGQIHVPFGQLANGSYLLLIQTEDHIWQKKMIKIE